jgi:bacterioferritin
MPEFVKDIEEIRRRAISQIEEGPVTGAYMLDKEQTVKILNEALATEIVCVLRYMHHYFMATGVHGKSVAEEFKEHADAEREHADDIAERIQQLGGKPDYNPGTLVSRSASQYVEGETLGAMIREDLIAERVVIEMYTDMVRYFGDKDPTTRVMIEGILRDEEEHAADLADLLFMVEPSSGRTEGVDPGTHPLGMQPESRMPAAQKQGPQPVPKRAGSGPGREDHVVAPAHAPGTTGHPTRQRSPQMEEFEPATESDEGAQMGATRSVHVTRPNRKKRTA